MRSGLTHKSLFHSYVAGDPLLEAERLATMDMVVMSGDSDVGVWDIFKPEKDNFKGLSKGLAFLKFTPSEAETLYNVIGTTVNVVGGIVSIVGAVGAVMDLMTKLGIISSEADAQEAALQAIGTHVQQIYGYLAGQERRGLYSEALQWRIDADLASNAVTNVATSRSSTNLDKLIDRAAELDRSILTMLDSGKGKVAFLRGVYQQSYTNWVEGAQTPYMATASGAPINYRDKSQDLQAEIWDPGHYLDILVRSLLERVAVATAIEPAFRSTGYDRKILAKMATNLLTFIHTWRASILVADPIYALNPGGNLRSPYQEAPFGIPIGAVDPVTGVSSFASHWEGFTYMGKYTGFVLGAWGGVYDETWATDPTAAVKAATEEQRVRVDHVIKVSGIGKMMTLQRKLLELASTPSGSDFVRLPNATFRVSRSNLLRVGMNLRNVVDTGTPETVDLGRLKVFSPNPDKTYEGKRYFRQMEKHFSFRMARRTEISRTRLGYRLRIGGSDSITLSAFSTARGDGIDFPSGTIEQDLDIETRIYDCYQTAHMGAADEDRFERDGRTPGIERLFMNERSGTARVRVTVTFEPHTGGDQAGYAGLANVTIANLEPQAYPDASILEVMVFETQIGMDSAPNEVIADSMTVHMTPSFVVLGADYFQDLHAAQALMVKTIKGINDKYSLQDLEVGRPDPDPAWTIRARTLEIQRGLTFMDAVQLTADPEVLQDIADSLPPIMVG